MSFLKPRSKGVSPKAFTSHLRRTMIAGVLALIPLVVTVWVVRLVFFWIDNQVQPLVRQIFGHDIRGVGVAFTIVAIYLAGLLVANFLGRFLIAQFEFLILKIPIIHWIYNLVKQTVDALKAAGNTTFRVVLVEWPRKGVYNIGFQTCAFSGADGKKYYNVLIPTTPTPQTGLLAIVPEEEVIQTDITIEDAVKLVVSSGVISSKELGKALDKARAAAAKPQAAQTSDGAAPEPGLEPSAAGAAPDPQPGPQRL